MQTKVRGRLVVEMRRGCLQVRSEGLCGAVEACIYTDFPLIQQPFWYVEPVPVSLAPPAEPIRGDIGLWRKV